MHGKKIQDRFFILLPFAPLNTPHTPFLLKFPSYLQVIFSSFLFLWIGKKRGVKSLEYVFFKVPLIKCITFHNTNLNLSGVVSIDFDFSYQLLISELNQEQVAHYFLANGLS